nr:immunoglobulin heavy chain junction region [Macaca mulatta]MOV52726.1 immunoglobulin heavy chain junction region [Macaca mulatta]MOW89126.1 immunoglobulin heavy chain junction region [Macaca mulatta]MOW89230.1 immunoglobulin heavy chain junction region [Macaca mulatta]MOW92244.1 immunoglobulin heavy chain junction region [Macaca mulatta]
CAKIWGFW